MPVLVIDIAKNYILSCHLISSRNVAAFWGIEYTGGSKYVRGMRIVSRYDSNTHGNHAITPT